MKMKPQHKPLGRLNRGQRQDPNKQNQKRKGRHNNGNCGNKKKSDPITKAYNQQN